MPGKMGGFGYDDAQVRRAPHAANSADPPLRPRPNPACPIPAATSGTRARIRRSPPPRSSPTHSPDRRRGARAGQVAALHQHRREARRHEEAPRHDERGARRLQLFRIRRHEHRAGLVRGQGARVPLPRPNRGAESGRGAPLHQLVPEGSRAPEPPRARPRSEGHVVHPRAGHRPGGDPRGAQVRGRSVAVRPQSRGARHPQGVPPRPQARGRAHGDHRDDAAGFHPLRPVLRGCGVSGGLSRAHRPHPPALPQDLPHARRLRRVGPDLARQLVAAIRAHAVHQARRVRSLARRRR